ncbi:MoaD/ThiS family protein [Microbacterium ureisolvens]|uniref:MoaD/ThiS family protein n=1 Tax=Microbacterium TaxID=33882 RepID=UPI000D65B0D2|nr:MULTISPECIES: MoaD/ThiS family protein [Microbacterium]
MAVVRYFAAAQEATGLDTERRSEPTLGALREAVSEAYPGLGGILPRCAVLVGGSRVADDTPLGSDDLVDVLPPFAGG